MRRAGRSGLWALLMSFGGVVCASGLQVAPTTLSLQASQNADGIWLSNIGNDVVHAQVRVYHWTQDGQGDQLVPSRGLIISPPMLQLMSGDRQLIRIIRTTPPPIGKGSVEDAYRLAIDELPIGTQGKPGLKFVLHYSVPIFIEPADSASLSPQLQWSLQPGDKGVALQVSNNGNGHAQLAGVSYIDASGHRTEITQGLLGYVLPGSTMRWTLKPPAAVFTAGGVLETMINGEKVTQSLSLADHSR